MKKTIGLIVTLLVSLVMLTGCVNINYEVEVKKDGSGDISYVYAFSNETLESLQVSAEDMVSSMKKQAEDNNYTTESYKDDQYEGFKATKHINDLEKEFSLKEAFGEEYIKESEDNKDNGIKIRNGFLSTKISQDAEIDLTSMQNVSSMVKMAYTVKLPVNVKSSNATTTNGNTLTWNLEGGQINKIEFTASGLNIWSIVSIIVIVIAILGIFCLVLLKNKDKSVKVENNKTEDKKVKEKKDNKENKKKEETK